MTVDDEPEPERLQQSHDFSSLQGLQVVGEGPWARDDREESPFLREALTLELEARAARFHQAVDASIVLANDGVVRWLGDPIAKLAPGPNLLTPSALILADNRLPVPASLRDALFLEGFTITGNGTEIAFDYGALDMIVVQADPGGQCYSVTLCP